MLDAGPVVDRQVGEGPELDAAAFARRLAAAVAQPAAGFALLLVRLRRSDRGRSLVACGVSAQVMLQARARLAAALRPLDSFTVVGADELLALLPEVTVDGVARLAMTRIGRALGFAVAADGAEVQVRAAIGCVLAPPEGATIERLVRAVEDARAAALDEEEGFAFAPAAGSAEDPTLLLPHLRSAIDQNALTVHYQPQYDLRSARWTGMEALVRWPRAEGLPPVPASVIADLAEHDGLMERLTRFVLDTALREVAEFTRDGIDLGVAVNLSPTSMTDRGLPTRIDQALDLWGVTPQRLTLEVTETSILGDAAAAMQVMRDLKQVGVRLSIDDFGTGHSSLARLRQMPLDELKIDRLFVGTMTRSPGDLQIVKSVIGLAHNFELRAVAEGVEDAPTLAMLYGMGCDTLQGYLCARPMPGAAVRDWWARRPVFGPAGTVLSAPG